MKRNNLVVVVALSLASGLAILVTLNGSSAFRLGGTQRDVSLATHLSTEPLSPKPILSAPTGADSAATATLASMGSTRAAATAPVGSTRLSELEVTSTPAPVSIGDKKETDQEDVLLLYDSQHASAFDVNFCKVVEYYGAGCQRAALDSSELTDRLLRDRHGDYFKLVGLSPSALSGERPLLNGDKVTTLKSAIATGLNLLVSVQQADPDSAVLAGLTDGAILGATRPQAARRDWLVATAAPEVTRVFAGLMITCTTGALNDLGLRLGPQGTVTTLLSAMDDAGAHYPVVAMYKGGAGSVFVDGGEQTQGLNAMPLMDLYYNRCHLSEFIPLMLIVRHTLGDRVWHSDRQYANLTIDDAVLTEPFGSLNYPALLKEMKLHNFHTTIAFIPANLNKSQPTVARLFLANPDRYSLVQHGNNHDGYEFYKYSVSEADTYLGQKYPARPLAGQEANIKDGLARMGEHQKLTGIPYDKIMVFPQGISPEPTFVLLKKYNYLATINGQDVPLDAMRPSRWDYGMYQANIDYGNFPALFRRHPGTYNPFRPDLKPFIFDLFLGKPALFYSHADQLFGSGIDAFDRVADQISQLPGKVEWHNLGYIIKHLYLEKTNSDGSMDVKMYGNDLIIAPGRGGGVTYHIVKEETLNVPIERLTVNGRDFPYRIEQGLLILDVVAPADGSPMEVVIRYAK